MNLSDIKKKKSPNPSTCNLSCSEELIMRRLCEEGGDQRGLFQRLVGSSTLFGSVNLSEADLWGTFSLSGLGKKICFPDQ